MKGSRAYVDGLVELQDAASQAAVLALPLTAGERVLDFCAGGGGKALALAALGAQVVAHDADPRRLRDLAPRARRAGATIPLLAPGERRGRFDGVLVDAPCSGSGTWRRAPDAKWRLTPARLADLAALQQRVLAEAAAHVRPAGWLAYATCSILEEENGAVLEAFRAGRTGWDIVGGFRRLPDAGGDGFFLSVMRAPS